MKKSVLCLVIFIILLASLVSARMLSASPKTVVKIQTSACKFGAMRCYNNALQECDGSAYITRAVCGPGEMCSVEKGCVKRTLLKRQRTLDTFYEMRLLECKEGEIVCRGRFVKVCRNHIWMQEFCAKNEWCHPKQGCVEKELFTRLKARDANIPSTQTRLSLVR